MITADYFSNYFAKTLPEPHAFLMSGIVLGLKKTVVHDFYRNLVITGTIHIVVASGMNLNLFSSFLVNNLSEFLTRRLAVALSLLFVCFYCLLVGLNPPIVRAGIMVTSSHLALFIGRESKGLSLLVMAALLMIFLDPLLVRDISFQLSFLASFGIVAVSPMIRRKIGKIRLFSFFSCEFADTIAAQVLTAPVIVLNFGFFNLISVIPNVLILFLIPFLMILGSLIVIFGFFLPPVAYFFAMLVWIPLTYLIGVVEFFGRFKLFCFEFEKLPWLLAFGYYFIMFSLLWRKRSGNE